MVSKITIIILALSCSSMPFEPNISDIPVETFNNPGEIIYTDAISSIPVDAANRVGMNEDTADLIKKMPGIVPLMQSSGKGIIRINRDKTYEDCVVEAFKRLYRAINARLEKDRKNFIFLQSDTY